VSADERRPNRRDVLVGTARSLALALLGGGAAALALRNGAGADCRHRDVCDACRLRRTCNQRNQRDHEPRARSEGDR
jgi:hypothetical protein